MAEKTSVTALLIDANGFEKRIKIPYKEGCSPVPSLYVMDQRSMHRAMRRCVTTPFGADVPARLYQLEFRFIGKWQYEGTGENAKSLPVYEEVIH